jgi:hypothetical protein
LMILWPIYYSKYRLKKIWQMCFFQHCRKQLYGQ